MIGHLPGAIRDFICEEDEDLPKEEQTIYRIKILSAEESAAIENKAVSFTANRQKGRRNQNEAEAHANTGTVVLDTLRAGLVGWVNQRAYDHEGKIVDVPFATRMIGKINGVPKMVITDDCINAMPPSARAQVSNAITEQTALTKDDLKN